MRVALVHYWLVTMAGGEKVLEALCRLYPQADIFTNVVDRTQLSPRLARHRIETTWVGKLPKAQQYYQKLLPLMPHALEQLNLMDYDLIISSESGPAKGVITRSDSLHVCYCHTPMRYLWEGWPQYMQEAGTLTRSAMRLLLPRLRLWDTMTAQRPDRIVANSATVAQRIRKYWRRDATVVHPPVATEHIIPKTAPGGDYYLCFGRLVGYKRIDLAIEACQRLHRELVIIGDGPDRTRLQALVKTPKIHFLGRCDDTTVAQKLRQAKALLFPGEEDFGIIPVEAQAAGTPVIAYQRGGATETILPQSTGVFFPEQTVESLCQAITDFEDHEDQFVPETLIAHARRFSPEIFAECFRQEVHLGWEALQGKLLYSNSTLQ